MSEEETFDGFVSCLNGRQVLMRVYDVPYHPDYERGVRGTIINRIRNPSLARILSAPAEGGAPCPVVLRLNMEAPISYKEYGKSQCHESKEVALVAYGVQSLRILVEEGGTQPAFAVFIPLQPGVLDRSDIRISDLGGVSNQAELELLEEE